MKANFKNWLTFTLFDLFRPCWRLSGRKVLYFADDYHEVHIKLTSKWYNRGPHGFIYGGSIFSALDAIPAFQYYVILGRNYVVWDKEATIHFLLPCKGPLYARNRVSPEEITEIKNLLESQKKLDRTYKIELVDDEGTVFAVVEKIIQMRKKTKGANDQNNQGKRRFI